MDKQLKGATQWDLLKQESEHSEARWQTSGKRVQHIHIKYDGLGFIPLNELMKEETA